MSGEVHRSASPACPPTLLRKESLGASRAGTHLIARLAGVLATVGIEGAVIIQNVDELQVVALASSEILQPIPCQFSEGLDSL